MLRLIGVTLIAVVPVLVLVPILLWRYRYRNLKARYTPDWGFSGRLDLAMWGVPFLIIVLLSIQLWLNTKDNDPYKPIPSTVPALQVQVVGLDWKWLFIYPEYDIGSVGELVFPSDRPVALRLTSDTVMQSFMISALAGQIYTMPGMETQLHLKASRPGQFKGENTQFNGIGFTHQKFRARAMTTPDFDQWVRSVKTHGVPLNDATYRLLAKRSTVTEARAALATAAMPSDVLHFSPVRKQLYGEIMHRYHSGKPIAAEEQPGGARYQAPPAN